MTCGRKPHLRPFLLDDEADLAGPLQQQRRVSKACMHGLALQAKQVSPHLPAHLWSQSCHAYAGDIRYQLAYMVGGLIWSMVY
jgi:hypothetical protein